MRERKEREGSWEGTKRKGESFPSFPLPITPRAPLDRETTWNE